MKALISLITVFSIVLPACISTTARKNISEIQGQWDIIKLMSEDIDRSRIQSNYSFLSFVISETSFSGSDGCNTFSGSWALYEGKLKFDKGPTTLMACTRPNDQDPYDYLFNEAISRNQVWEKHDDGAYHLRRDLPPEYRDWRITEAGYLELSKDGKVTLIAKPVAAN